MCFCSSNGFVIVYLVFWECFFYRLVYYNIINIVLEIVYIQLLDVCFMLSIGLGFSEGGIYSVYICLVFSKVESEYGQI